MTKEDIGKLIRDMSDADLALGEARLKGAVQGYEVAQWKPEPVVILEMTGLPSTNAVINALKSQTYSGKRLIELIRDMGYWAAYYWMEKGGVQTHFVHDYKRNPNPKVKARDIYRAVSPVIGPEQLVEIFVQVPPGRDIDGTYTKALFDGFTDANLWADDRQIEDLRFRRVRSFKKDSPIVITIYPYEAEEGDKNGR